MSLEIVDVAQTFHREYFSAKGVTFVADGSPRMPLGICGDTDLEMLIEKAATAAMRFLEKLSARLDMCFDGYVDEWVTLGWRHGFLTDRPADEPDRVLVPVVLTLDMKKMELVIDRRASVAALPRDAALSPLERLVAEQQPEVWNRWKVRDADRGDRS